jgi:hypothetical protein
MKKIADLREYLEKRILELRRNPDQLLVFIEDGRIIFHNGGNYSHNYKAAVRVIVTDWKGGADALVIAVLEWMGVREPGFNPDTAIKFDLEILDKETVDIAFTLEITERVIVKLEGTERTIVHDLPEPPMQMNSDARWQFFTQYPGGEETIE